MKLNNIRQLDLYSAKLFVIIKGLRSRFIEFALSVFYTICSLFASSDNVYIYATIFMHIFNASIVKIYHSKYFFSGRKKSRGFCNKFAA